MSFDKRLGIAWLALVVLGCSSKETSSSLGPPPPCTGQFCGAASGGGVVTTGSGGSTGTGTGSGIDVSGTVTLVLSPDFMSGSPFTGDATIKGVGPGGKVVTAPYVGNAGGAGGGGSIAQTFTLDGVDPGPGWLVVEDTSGGSAGILTTYSPVNLIPTSPVPLPVMDLATLQNIASSLPGVSINGISTGASQIVVFVTGPGGAPLPGVSVGADPTEGMIAYDTGDGVYDDSATMTGSAGTIILFNANLDGDATIGLTYTSQATMMPATASITLQGAAGAATLGGVELQ